MNIVKAQALSLIKLVIIPKLNLKIISYSKNSHTM